jgi:hypothetical protein
MLTRLLALVFCFTFAGHGFAANSAAEVIPVVKTEAVISQQAKIRADLLAGKGRFASMPGAKRDELLNRQAIVIALLEGKQSTAELAEHQRLQAFNHLEWIEAAINGTPGDQMVCKNTRQTGSNRITKVCRTVEQIELERELARKQLMNQGGCGFGCTR